MSALGQKQTCAAQKGMSALPPKADMCIAHAACPLSAKSGHSDELSSHLFDHLACAGEQYLQSPHSVDAEQGL